MPRWCVRHAPFAGHTVMPNGFTAVKDLCEAPGCPNVRCMGPAGRSWRAATLCGVHGRAIPGFDILLVPKVVDGDGLPSAPLCARVGCVGPATFGLGGRGHLCAPHGRRAGCDHVMKPRLSGIPNQA